ncbi:MAG: chromate efflux transporter [Akkermansiaceae bacterium]
MLECFVVALRLGLTSFGGPVAHVSYFREEYVTRRMWVSEERFGELMALTQFIPGPGSSQLGAAIGHHRAGLGGGFAAWLGFTLPSAIVMVLVALGMGDLSGDHTVGMLKGLKLVALAVVLDALLGMRKSLAPDLRRMLMAGLVFVVLWFFVQPWMTLVMIAFSAALGSVILPADKAISKERVKGRGMLAWFAMLVFFALLFASLGNGSLLAGIYRAGALVFGGGHVVLPMLRETMVTHGPMSEEVFLGGYGATQAVPGPVFTFAAFLGASANIFGSPWLGAGAAIVAVFLPGMLLLGGTLNVWGRLRGKRWAQRAVKGANAGVVGILGVALVQMATRGSIGGVLDACLLVAFFLILKRKLVPVWVLVVLAAGGGAMLS